MLMYAGHTLNTTILFKCDQARLSSAYYELSKLKSKQNAFRLFYQCANISETSTLERLYQIKKGSSKAIR